MWRREDGTYWERMGVCRDCGSANYTITGVDLTTGQANGDMSVGDVKLLNCPTCSTVTTHVTEMVQVPEPATASSGGGMCLIIMAVGISLTAVSTWGGVHLFT